MRTIKDFIAFSGEPKQTLACKNDWLIAGCRSNIGYKSDLYHTECGIDIYAYWLRFKAVLGGGVASGTPAQAEWLLMMTVCCDYLNLNVSTLVSQPGRGDWHTGVKAVRWVKLDRGFCQGSCRSKRLASSGGACDGTPRCHGSVGQTINYVGGEWFG